MGKFYRFISIINDRLTLLDIYILRRSNIVGGVLDSMEEQLIKDGGWITLWSTKI